MASTKGEISVELRLSDKKIQADIDKALGRMKQQLAASTKLMTVSSSGGILSMGKDADKASSAIGKTEGKVRNLTNALKDQKKAALEAWRASIPTPKVQGVGFDEKKPSTRFSKWYAGQSVPYSGSGLATDPSKMVQPIKVPVIQTPIKGYGMADLKQRGMMTPQLPAVNFPKLPNAPKEPKEKNPQGILQQAVPFIERRLGLYGITPALKAIGVLGIAAVGVGVAFVTLKKLISETTQAYENARRVYAKNLSSGGMGMSYTATTTTLSSVLGIGEDQVMQYAYSFNSLNEKLQFSRQTIIETTQSLASVGMEFKITEQNISALWAQFATGISPAIKALTVDFNDFLTTLGQTGVITFAAEAWDKISQSVVNAIGVTELLFNTYETGLGLMEDATKLAWGEIVNLIAGTKLGKLAGVQPINTSAIESHMKAMTASLGKEAADVAKNWFGASTKDIPANPPANAKQMPFSSWEKMGLVIGTMGKKDWQEVTAKNTAKLVALFQNIANNHGGMNGGSYSPMKGTGLPRSGANGIQTAFGNPAASQP